MLAIHIFLWILGYCLFTALNITILEVYLRVVSYATLYEGVLLFWAFLPVVGQALALVQIVEMLSKLSNTRKLDVAIGAHILALAWVIGEMASHA